MEQVAECSGIRTSIADFVISNYLDGFSYIDELLISLRTPESISNLNSLKVSGVIDEEYYCSILVGLAEVSENGTLRAKRLLQTQPVS